MIFTVVGKSQHVKPRVASELDVSQPKASKAIDDETGNHVRSALCEYFNTFIVIGYNVDNNRQVVQYTKTPADVDALNRFVDFASESNLVYQNSSRASMQRETEGDYE